MASRFSTQNISAVQGRDIFFDANILLYLFWPTTSHHWERIYSSVFGNLLRQQNKLVVDFLVISEAINRAIRIEYKKHLSQHSFTEQTLPFKAYRDSTAGIADLNDIYDIVKNTILPRFVVQGKAFSKSEIEAFFTIESLDFVDKGIASICLDFGYVLLTNDKDYKTSGIDILTSNPALLRN